VGEGKNRRQSKRSEKEIMGSSKKTIIRSERGAVLKRNLKNTGSKKRYRGGSNKSPESEGKGLTGDIVLQTHAMHSFQKASTKKT